MSIRPEAENVVVHWEGAWREKPPAVEVRLPGFVPVFPPEGADHVTLDPVKAL